MPHLTVDQVLRGTKCPAQGVGSNWPLILQALEAKGIGGVLTQIAAAATVAVETGSFAPVTERMASITRQPDLYKRQRQYYPYIGRGFIQITWKENYKRFGDLVGVNLVAFPTEACNPEVAAQVLAEFFVHRRVDQAAEDQDWQRVRKLVNGGLNGWDVFHGHVERLLAEVADGL